MDISSAHLKSFLNRRFTFHKSLLKVNTVISKQLIFSLSLSLTHTHTQIYKSCFQLMDAFFHCVNSFPGCSSWSRPWSENLFLILGNTRLHNRFYIWIVTFLKSTTRWHGCISFSKIINNCLGEERTMGSRLF